MRGRALAPSFLLLLAGSSARAAPAAEPRVATAVRLAPGKAIHLDGRLDEEAWAAAPPLADFVQRDPSEGAPATEATEVRFLYDADTLFVGARLSTREPRAVHAPVSRRDDGEQADSLTVYFDTFHDRRTAYAFGVTAAGARLDGYYSQDDDWAYDNSLDPVWEARVSRDGSGWTAEMRIPFSQVRFAQGSTQVWGVNVRRSAPGRNEEDFWAPMPKQQNGWASRFGTLAGILGIRGGQRRELLPFLAADSTLSTDRDPADPFDRGANLAGRAGGDFKLAVGPALGLEGTVRPDFGQVEADPAEVNLSAFETFFAEKRPFFIEGAEMLQCLCGSTYFYSRRIGAVPRGEADGDFVDYPRATSILGALKLTGRTAGGLSLGALAAVTGAEEARVADLGGPVSSTRVAPRAGYAVVRGQRLFGASQSTVGATATLVHRDLAAADPLATLLARNAFTLAADTKLRFQGGLWELTADAGVSRVDGEPSAILALQQSSARYYQRPDTTHVRLDPSRRSLSGFTAEAVIEKNAGRHWLGFASVYTYSPGFELNNAGQLPQADLVRTWASLQYRETQPGRFLRGYYVSVRNLNTWNLAGDWLPSSVGTSASATWKNFWTSSLSVTVNPRAQDPRLTRGGPSMGTARAGSLSLTLAGPTSAATRWQVSAYGAGDENGGRARRVSGSISARPSPRFQVSLAPYLEQRRDARQYVATKDGGRAVTYDKRYVFAAVDRTTLSAQLRLTAAFTPDLTVDLYAEPFAADGRYADFGELAVPRGRALRPYGSDGTTLSHEAGAITVTDGPDAFTLADPDFAVRSFRANLVLRWEYRPGSTLYFVWQQDRFQSLPTTAEGVDAGDLLRSPRAPGTHVLAVKASFWLPLR